MHANEREFMKKMQAQLVEIGLIYPLTHYGGYGLYPNFVATGVSRLIFSRLQ